MIHCNELDPLKDEGIAMYQLLMSAGVQVTGKVILGTHHAGDLFVAVTPDLFQSFVASVMGFAKMLTRGT